MNKFLRLIAFSMLVLAFAMTVSATIVSPALNVIAKNNKMIKSGLIYSDIYFSESDFMKCLGITSVDSITVESLPAAADGTLKLGNLNVSEGQTIDSKYLSVLRFVPANESIIGTELVFGHNDTDIPCMLKFVKEVNFAPVFAEEGDVLHTYRNVSCYGNVSLSDPEGDITDLQIVSYPEHGTLTITNQTRGSYKYTPSSNFIGNDSFTVVARDGYGNYSSAQKIEVKVEKANISFSDTKGHWCENAAIYIHQKGVAEAINYNDEMVFCPDDNVTREEFVAMAMKALGASTLTDSATSFADNGSIDVKYRPYVATAQRLGYINGKEVDGLMCFVPKGNITKAEAAMVINNILGYEEGEYTSVFADDSAIPVWAKSAVYALTSAGVFNGNEDGKIVPSAILSRAETAQMLYNILKK